MSDAITIGLYRSAGRRERGTKVGIRSDFDVSGQAGMGRAARCVGKALWAREKLGALASMWALFGP